MSVQHERRLYAASELVQVLSLAPEKVDWLINTGQLPTIRIAGETRIDSRDVDRLITTYKSVQSRRIQ